MKSIEMPELLRFLSRPIFLVFDMLGLGIFVMSSMLSNLWATGLSTAGSAFLTIGITLPVGLYFQLRSNAESSKILSTCHDAGIRSVFRSRKRDAFDLRKAIDKTAALAPKIDLLGIAFHSFFDPSAEHSEPVVARLRDPKIPLRILLLDPSCEAAIKRAKIERGHATIANIQNTLNENLQRSLSHAPYSKANLPGYASIVLMTIG